VNKSIDTRIPLSHGGPMPILGLGVYQSGAGKATVDAVTWALEAGYRHVDTAAMYGNETEVGEAVRASGIPRDARCGPSSKACAGSVSNTWTST
jgi:diketogulonate reductase-like aldo/keto reductase